MVDFFEGVYVAFATPVADIEIDRNDEKNN
jgi:hypothetical protein